MLDVNECFKLQCRDAFVSPHSRKLRDFWSEEDGSIIVLSLLLLIAMLVAGGMAVDFMRLESARIKIQAIADISVLSSVSLGSGLDPEAVVRSHFESAGFDPSIAAINVEGNGTSTRSISVVAPTQVDTIYLRLIGIPKLDAFAIAEAEEGVSEVEISLVLDYSASMRTGGSTGTITETSTTRRGRIGDLQDAASAFAKALLQPEFAGRFSLNIVPYGGSVNPGRDMFDLLGGEYSQRIYIEDSKFDLGVNSPFVLADTIFWADDANEKFPGEYIYAGPDGGFGALTGFAALAGIGLSDDVPLSGLLSPFKQVLGADTNLRPEEIGLSPLLFGPDGKYGTDDDDETETGQPARIAYRYDPPAYCLDIRGADMATSTLPSQGLPQLDTFMRYGYKNWEIEQQVRGWGWCPAEQMRIQYAQQDPDDVADFFSQITTYDGTGTDLGMKWGLALLDPTTRPALTALNTIDNGIVPDASVGRPRDWDDPKTKKIIVLMTDGFNTAQARLDQAPRVEDLYEQAVNNKNISWHVPKDTTQAQFIALCDVAKDPLRGVEIYTVAFETSASAGQLMSDCASSPANFYSTSGAGLTEVFEGIAQQITALRLSR